MNLVSFAEFAFCVLFIGLIFIGTIIVCAVVVEFLLVPLIRMMPHCHDFLEPPPQEFDRIKTQDAHLVLRVAIDYVIAARLKLERERKEQLRQLLLQASSKLAPATLQPPFETEQVFDFATLGVANKSDGKRQKANHDADGQQWGLAVFKNGVTPYFLTHKLPSRDGLKTCFSPQRNRALRFDRHIAERWSEKIEGAILVPLNARARRTLAEERKNEHATA